MTITMKPGLRKFALTAHVTASVGLLGSIISFLALAIAGLTSPDTQTIRAAYVAMDLIARLVIVPLAFASLLTGLVQSLGTAWGLFRHYWVLAKLVLTLFATGVLLAKMELVSYAAGLAAAAVLQSADLRAAGMQLAVHAAGGLLLLLVPAILSVYKPRGLTPYGRRMQREPSVPQRPRLDANGDGGFWPNRRPAGSATRRACVFGMIAVILVAHIVVLHLTGVIGAAPGGH